MATTTTSRGATLPWVHRRPCLGHRQMAADSRAGRAGALGRGGLGPPLHGPRLRHGCQARALRLMPALRPRGSRQRALVRLGPGSGRRLGEVATPFGRHFSEALRHPDEDVLPLCALFHQVYFLRGCLSRAWSMSRQRAGQGPSRRSTKKNQVTSTASKATTGTTLPARSIVGGCPTPVAASAKAPTTNTGTPGAVPLLSFAGGPTSRARTSSGGL